MYVLLFDVGRYVDIYHVIAVTHVHTYAGYAAYVSVVGVDMYVVAYTVVVADYGVVVHCVHVV